MRGALTLVIGIALVALVASSACPNINDDGSAGETKVEGSPYGADFKDSNAGHKVMSEGAADSTVVRIAPRPDVCAAVMDPADEVDPSLIIVIQGTQTQTYQVVPLDYQGPPGGGAPPPSATVTLQTHTSHCDAGVEDSAGISCAINRGASGGQIVLDTLVEGELATGAFAIDFPEGGGSVEGTFSAPACLTIR